MGTNYYLHENACTACHRGDVLHVGKSSVGWAFIFRGHPDRGIVTSVDWRKRIAESLCGLYDEYDRLVTPEEFWELVEAKRGGRVNPGDRIDPEGNHFYDYKFS